MVGIYRSFLRDGGDPRVFLEFPDVLLHCLHGAAGAGMLATLEIIYSRCPRGDLSQYAKKAKLDNIVFGAEHNYTAI